MSATASSRVSPLLIPLLVGAGLLNLGLMYVLPGAETIPFHLVWIGLSVVYGLVTWPLRPMLAVLAVVAVSTGYVLVHHAAAGAIGWEETTEVPLMTAVFVVMVWHVRRRQKLTAEIERLAEAERRRAMARDHFVRVASHELRTPITVARGYAELLRSATGDPSLIADCTIVIEELDRLAGITHRLVTLVQLEGADVREIADVDAALIAMVDRWRPAADREWRIRSAVGRASFNPERLKAAVDSLVENAIKFTEPGDVIAVEGDGNPKTWAVTVTDSGPGMSPESLTRLAALGADGLGVTASGTGLGLATVSAVVRSWNGRLTITTPPGGGTVVRMEFPRGATVHDGRMTVLS
ncbi:sensor histidine kinase [Actinoplanes sp. CA-030573]|uniref:sensor histidine kinase n=1 Tax=Actinoplanes sp. CA-030573 TaxID=3239898 RepID=UPI003D8BDC54